MSGRIAHNSCAMPRGQRDASRLRNFGVFERHCHGLVHLLPGHNRGCIVQRTVSKAQHDEAAFEVKIDRWCLV